MTNKFLYVLAGALILALLMIIQADKYYRSSFYGGYLGAMMAVILGLWIIGCFIIWKSVSSSSLGAGLFRLVGMLSLVILVGMVIEHFVLTGFYANAGSRPRFSIIKIIIVWLGGVVLFLGWHLVFLLGRTLFSSTSSPALRVTGFVITGLTAVAVLFIIGINIDVRKSAQKKIYSLADIPPGKVAVVFGAGIWEETLSPTAVLQDRIKAAAELYQAGKVERVLLSGAGVDGGLEVDVMEQYALESGIPAEVLLLDPLGVRTYATCQQARDTFGVDDAVLVTQNFHLSRALFLCNSLDVSSVGLSADLRTYSPLNRAIWFVREALATAYAWLEVTVFK